MSAFTWIIVALVAFDALMLACFFWMMKTRPPLDRKGRLVTAAALSGFVFQAFLFFDGAILAVHLTTLAIIYAFLLVPLMFAGRTDESGSSEPS